MEILGFIVLVIAVTGLITMVLIQNPKGVSPELVKVTSASSIRKNLNRATWVFAVLIAASALFL